MTNGGEGTCLRSNHWLDQTAASFGWTDVAAAGQPLRYTHSHMNFLTGRLIRAAFSASLAALFVLPAATACADQAPSRKIGFIGCMAKPDDVDLGTQISESLEQRLVRTHAAGFEFLPDAVARGRASLKGGPINPQRIVAAGRAIGADKVVVCLITYKRQRAETVQGEAKTKMVSREVTDYVEETYYTEVENPDYEPPIQAAIPLGNIGPVKISALVGGPSSPKTIKEKHVRRVPQKRTVSDEVTEAPPPAEEKSGFVRLQAAYLIVDVASGKIETRDAVSYLNELEAIFDSMESDKDLRRKAGESTVDSLERSVLVKLASVPGK